MLTTLCIEHFAIVQKLELDFTKGLTAFTGETGAGKSIMIDALMLALGGRADSTVVRPGCDKCDITAGFLIDEHTEPALWLSENDIQAPDKEVYIRRVIYAEGRSKSYINGQLVPLQKVRELSEKLVHIHGQHQHQTLMQHATQRQQLDNYAKHQSQLKLVARCFQEYQHILEQIEHLENQDLQQDKMHLLQFQLDELNSLGLEEGELQALNEEHQLLHHAKDYLEQSQVIQALLNAEDQPDICSGLNHILQLLSHLPQEQSTIITLTELINNALIQCEEASDEIQNFSNKVQLDPERLQAVEDRISTIHAIARKNHKEAWQLAAFKSQIENELEQFELAQEHLAALKIQLKQVQNAYEVQALKLSTSRQDNATKLAKEITACIQQLGMPKGLVEIACTQLDKPQVHGQDKVELKVCTNPGMELDALSKIASGGELSRIGLAIQMITAQRGATPTLLFDEVDVGIGGNISALVGKMLRQLGERLQVFCVTHQPQVAAAAHQHYQVSKHSNAEQTITEVKRLDEVSKIQEIARMLGGLTITEQSLSHAKELVSSL